MTILNLTSDGLLPVFLSLHGTMASFKALSQERLLEICAPSTVVPHGRPRKARQTLTRWIQFGAFVEKDGEVKLAPELARIAPGDLNGLRREVLRILLRFDNSPFLEKKDVLGSAEEDDREETGAEDVETEESAEARTSLASDFTRSAAWAMLQDPYSFVPKAGEVVELQNRQEVKPRAIRNVHRWPGFEMWTAFTGVTFPTYAGHVLNPALALRLALDEILVDDERLSLDTFIARTAKRLPFLDGGRYQSSILDASRAPSPRNREISRSLSLALLQLQAEGNIALLDVSDAERRTLLGRGATTYPYTHIERRQG